jgi:hypothetical protein
MPRRTAAIVAALAALAVAPAAAHAGRPGVWTPITTANGDNTDQVGLLRTPDGMLHVAWSGKTIGDPVHDDLSQTLIAPGGNAGVSSTIAGGWIGIGAPQLAPRR